MDTLVSRYSRQAYEQNEPFDNEVQEMMDATSSLTTKFAMPPIAQVGDHLPFPQEPSTIKAVLHFEKRQ